MDAIMGPLSDRLKTDIRVPRVLSGQVDLICCAAGVPKNAFYSLAAGLLVIQLSPLLPGSKRAGLLSSIANLFQKALTEANKTA